MTFDCERCGRAFGGMFGFDRHLNRRKDRCRTDGQLRARGLRVREDGVWVQAVSFYRQLRLFPLRPGRRRQNPPRKLWGASIGAISGHRRPSALPGQIALFMALAGAFAGKAA